MGKPMDQPRHRFVNIHAAVDVGQGIICMSITAMLGHDQIGLEMVDSLVKNLLQTFQP
ncbi:hypothetical protein D3C71_2244840 [compost metagenome]